MSSKHCQSRGFTLIASMLLLVLLSSIAIGLMFLANGSGHIGNNDLEANVAYYGAESGMEKLTTDLLTLYQNKLSPNATDLATLASTSAPSSALVGNMTYLESAAWTNPGAGGLPQITTSVIGSGPYAGLNAQMVPITLKVSAIRPSGAAVNMTRGVQVALIPVFQFGVFSDSDLSYFPGPLFNFKGRVHTNGNLFLAADSGPLILASNVTAHGEIIRDVLANGFSNGGNYQGNVLLPTSPQGCDNDTTGTILPGFCENLGMGAGSWSGGVPPAGFGVAGWSAAPFTQFLTKGVPTLNLPFVQGAGSTASSAQIQIVKEPLAGEVAASPLGGSREFNKANIHILLADTQADLHPSAISAPDADDILLGTPGGLTINTVGGQTTIAMARTGQAGENGWTGGPPTGEPDPWNLVNGWLRVEYRDAAGTWHGITREWLQLGFARGFLPPAAPLTNPVHPKAILILQELADRDASGVLDATDAPSTVYGAGAASAFSWYPINFYDPREGFPRDNSPLAGTQCYVNGIMNAVELDVGNLNQWILGTIPGSGSLVDPSTQNGYLVYFSDRRGQNHVPTNGKFGFEDVVNSGSATGTPDGIMDASVLPSPEDVDQNNALDVWGATNVGDGFHSAPTAGNPYQPVDCLTVGRKNRVTGARHVLKLVDGALNRLPMPGFTVAAENPVYVQGDYNSNAADSAWNSPSVNVPHAAAAVIADAVTLLSNNWLDGANATVVTPTGSMLYPNSRGSRNATNTYYRMAIASGKNINFPQPAGGGNDFGTDGGVHNFLRYIEDWGGATLSYRGSMVSLYYAQYATGTFKCCNLVYSPPTRNYSFDEDFLTPSNLPPGTPMLQDIENLSYWQNFSPCTTQSGGTCTN